MKGLIYDIEELRKYSRFKSHIFSYKELHSMSENMVFELIECKKILVSDVIMRKAQVDTPAFKDLQRSIAADGVLTTILVRPIDKDDKGHTLELGDGAQRLEASIREGIELIPASIKEMTDQELANFQIQANSQGVPTTKKQFSPALLRRMAVEPGLTQHDLAEELHRSDAWIGMVLGLVKLDDRLGGLCEKNLMPVSIGYKLAKLPPDEQVEWVQAPKKILSDPDAIEKIENRLKEIKRAGADAPRVFAPIEKFIGKNRLKDLIAAAETSSRTEYAEGLRASVGMDEESVAQQERDWDTSEAQKTEDKAKTKLERLAKQKREVDAELEKINN